MDRQPALSAMPVIDDLLSMQQVVFQYAGVGQLIVLANDDDLNGKLDSCFFRFVFHIFLNPRSALIQIRRDGMASNGNPEKIREDRDDREKSARSGERAREYVEDADTARRITRKCDLHILPWVSLRKARPFVAIAS